MAKRGLIGKFLTIRDGEKKSAVISLFLGKWHQREKLPTVQRNQIYIPLTELQLKRLDQYIKEIRQLEKRYLY